MTEPSYWRWYPRGEYTCRLHRHHDEGLHVAANGDLYFIMSDHRIKTPKIRSEKLKQA